jgi:hypothetical protein
MIFDELKVWARIMNLGFELMNTERGTPLAARLGTVERFDVDDKGKAWGSILRARITIKPMEPIMRCVSVFSRKRQMMMHFDVMYERLPKFCFSCGLIGHSLITCLNPADHDGEGKLPYNGDRLCVPEKRSASEQTQSTRFSRKQSEMGPNSQAFGMDAGKQKDSGEVSSPAKNSARARKQSNPREKTAVLPGRGKLAASQMISGQKRKSKQVYLPKLVNVPVMDGALVPVGSPSGLGLGDHVVAESGGLALDDSNKKQKTILSRSAGLAAAVEQPRHTQ